MGQVRVLSKKKFDVELFESQVIINPGISTIDEDIAKANPELVRILNRIEDVVEDEKVSDDDNKKDKDTGEDSNKDNEGRTNDIIDEFLDNTDTDKPPKNSSAFKF